MLINNTEDSELPEYNSRSAGGLSHALPIKVRSANCYVAIRYRRILWRCRNLWMKVSQFGTGVAICDGKYRNLWQRQNMQLNGIYSINFDKYAVL